VRIEGYLHRDRSPYLDVMVSLKKGALKRKISFLIDTGSPRTIISERDALKLGLDFDRLERLREELLGLGGFSETFKVRNVRLFFASENGGHSERLTEVIVHRESDLPEDIKKQIPSLLGRDMIGRFVLVLDEGQEVVFMTDEHPAWPDASR
jgi:hypothetical protein